MGYTTLSIRKNNRIRKYILFYADYLQEAWLSEVKDNDTTKIIRQFRCKDTIDFELLTASLTGMGEIINLNSDETIVQHLSVLEMKLEKPFASKFSESLNAFHDKLVEKFSLFPRRHSKRLHTA